MEVSAFQRNTCRRQLNLLGAELVEVPVLARAQAAFWDSQLRGVLDTGLGTRQVIGSNRCFLATTTTSRTRWDGLGQLVGAVVLGGGGSKSSVSVWLSQVS